ncbi:MAG: DNA polymerase Y family protein [Hyphomicrobiaceae bacterium]|nr:DNA polymerase Y family protein [Hyphomicrobiaceae bacterium]
MPFLTADRWRRECLDVSASTHDAPPLIFIEKNQNASRLVAVDQVAKTQGLLPGLSLADARARVPTLRAVTYDAHADIVFLSKLADAALAFTPTVALEEPHGLTLDITGCAHLFGDETGLVAKLKAMLRANGLSLSRVAVASTPDMARALARFGDTDQILTQGDREVRALPVAALEGKPEDIRTLQRAGLKTIGAVADRPSILFTARFTQAFTIRLGRILGEEDRRITPRRAPPVYLLEQRCPEPVGNQDVIERIILDLAQRLAKQLEINGDGGRVFEAAFFRSDGAVRSLRIETSQPTRDTNVVMRLYRDRLDALADPLDPGFGFDLIQLHALRVEPSHVTQSTFDTHDEDTEQIGRLVDRLSVMFGRDRITQLQAANTHVPERSQIVRPAAEKLECTRCNAQPFEAKPIRPLHLFVPPQIIEMTGCPNEPQPARFCWRRVMHHVVFAEGPERIADEWWRVPSGFGLRDYFRVETVQGQRFWIFRAAITRERGPQWFLHGVFA